MRLPSDRNGENVAQYPRRKGGTRSKKAIGIASENCCGEQSDQVTVRGNRRRKLVLDALLQDVIQKNKLAVRAMEEELSTLKSRHELPLRKFGENHIRDFRAAAHAGLREGGELAREYLHAVVSRITVYASEVSVEGGNLLITSSLSSWSAGKRTGGVPRLVSDWCGKTRPRSRL